LNTLKLGRVAMLCAMLAAGLLAPLFSHGLNAQDESWRPFYAMRPLDFSAFEDELAALTDEDIARLDALILERSIPELTASMDSGELTSYELTLYYLYRIQSYDVDQLNAIIDLNPNALEVARNRDEERAKGVSRGRLHGIPVLLKANITTESYLYTSAGAAALATAVADRDSFLVSELRKDGAVILAKTNMTEWANWMHYAIANGYSAVGGQIVSPYADWIDPSGSSSGSAVAITANFAPLAMGTETIGSIISPSGRSGVVGFKPSLGLISRDLLIPITDEIDTAGPIARNVTDVATAMNVLAGVEDPADPLAAGAHDLIGADFTAALSPDALQGIRVGIIAADPAESDDYQLDYYALWEEVAAFEAAGAEVVIVRPGGFPDPDWGLLFSCDLREEVGEYLTQVHADFTSLAEIAAYNEEHPDVMPYGQERFYEAAECPLTSEEIAELGESTRATAATYMDTLFAEYDVDMLVTIDDVFSLQYALAGFPAVSVPRGLSYDGVPSGLTMISPYLTDVWLLGYAYAFEQAGAWRVPPQIGEPAA
jgi:amidase